MADRSRIPNPFAPVTVDPNAPPTEHELGQRRLMTEWNGAAKAGNLLSALRVYWRDFVPKVCKPSLNTSENKRDDAKERELHKYLFAPLERFILGDNYERLLERFEQIEREKPAQICGHVFKGGEPTYSCRECAMDPTCVLCIICFEMSSHREHKYRMNTSSGGGYCDCGDVEAWKTDPCCDRHKPKRQLEEIDNPLSTVPEDVRMKATAVFDALLRHTLELLFWEADDKLPEGMHVEEQNDEFTTMLFNDEVHTYEQVISTLKRAVHCSQKQAVDFATTVDREGRSCVSIGSYSECDKAKSVIEKSTSRLGSKALKVQVLHSSVVSQQMFAVKIVQWLKKFIAKSQGLRELFCQVAMEPRENNVSLLEEFLRIDTSLWKAARIICHQTVMAAILPSAVYKKKFAILFTVLYHIISSDYIKDDHDHSVCVVSESVQLFTVPSIARMLIKDYNLLSIILNAFLQVCETKKKQNGKFTFERSERNPGFRRGQYMLHDLKYALSVPPGPGEWNDDLRRNFVAGFKVLLQLLSHMQGMDAVTRQTGQHIEFEPEWEGAFNLQVRLDDNLTLFLQWCETDKDVLMKTYCDTLEAIVQCRDPKHKVQSLKLAGHEAQVVKYDVASQPISIHLPLSRLLAGLHLSLAQFDLTFPSLRAVLKTDDVGPVDIFEQALRVQVLIAQTHAGMWRRNGFSLLNQIYFYSNVKCRREMYDRDILLIQAGGALMNPDEFLIHLINKYGLVQLMKEDYDKPSSSSEDLVRQVVIMSEEMLNLLIILVSERFHTGIGDVDPNYALKREVVHQLCIQPMAHSELRKAMPDDPKDETDLDSILEEVAACKEAGGSGKKMFELKPEFFAMYNPYFYHYHRSDQTKSEEEQRKRKKASGGDQCLPPPEPPKFKPAFEPLINLLSCDVMLYVMKLILKRSVAQRSRSWSEAQLERVLHLIGLALYEDERYGEARNFPFLTKSTSSDGIFSLLESLVGHENVAHGSQRDLLNWVLGQFRRVMKLKDVSLHPENATVDVSANDEKAVREREKKAKLAEKRRKQLLEQMSKMQKNFIKENAELFESTDSDLQAGAGDMEVGSQPHQFPVCVGPNQNEMAHIPVQRSTCILCQEEQDITLGGRAMVLATFSQKSTVLARKKGKMPEVNRMDPLLTSVNRYCGVHTSTCGHVMHADCWQRFFDSVVSQERRRMFRFRPYASFDIEKMEFLCPLCETISNSVMPIIPPLLSLRKPAAERAQVDISFDDWCDSLQKIRVASNQEDLETDKAELSPILQPCPLTKVPSLLDDRLAQCITSLYGPMEMENDGISDSIGQMVMKMAKDIYSVNNMIQPDDDDSFIPALVWQTCAYTIQIVELSLRDEGKPLFGAFTSRQKDCLSALVKLTSILGQMFDPRTIRIHCTTLLRLFLRDKSMPHQPVPLMDTEMFHNFVALSASVPLLFAESDNISLSQIASGDLGDLHVLRLCLVAHLVQLMMKRDFVNTPDSKLVDTEQLSSDSSLYKIYTIVRPREEMCTPGRLKMFLDTIIMPYLRSTALFYHFLTDIPPPDELLEECADPIPVILRYLGLPPDLSGVLDGPVVERLAEAWCAPTGEMQGGTRLPKTELWRLPNDYSQLINALSTFTCPNSDGDDSRAPTMCLVCGKLLCSQSYCCQRELKRQMVGAATYHAHVCGAGIGIFLRVRECQVLLLASRTKGCFLPAPFLDKYGETDQMLRRGNPLSLSYERFNKLQKLWITHGIPEEIAHQLESNTNLMNYEWHNL